jgi:hypothetical protein
MRIFAALAAPARPFVAILGGSQILAAGVSDIFNIYITASTTMTIVILACCWDNAKKIHEDPDLALRELSASDFFRTAAIIAISVLWGPAVGIFGKEAALDCLLPICGGLLVGLAVAFIFYLVDTMLRAMAEDEESHRRVRESQKASEPVG